MIPSTPLNTTQFLLDSFSGDEQALERLVSHVYADLRNLAGRSLRRERPDHTLNTTALVNEAYLRLVDQRCTEWRHKAHFLAIAAQMMRRVLVDHARKRASLKRRDPGGRVGLSELHAAPGNSPLDLIALDEALQRLVAFDPQLGKVVELRYFAGLTVEEIAQVLQVSAATVKREWTLAKAWLQREMGAGGR